MMDSFARRSLWEAGLDYLHGTGHGVGAFLNVHEGPQQISFRVTAHDAALEAGIFMSDGMNFHQGVFVCGWHHVFYLDYR